MDTIELKSKPRYEILDGLRGVAAVLVVIYHLCESHFGIGETHPLNHGYLAVDFFFVLSGFVIGYAMMTDGAAVCRHGLSSSVGL